MKINNPLIPKFPIKANNRQKALDILSRLEKFNYRMIQSLPKYDESYPIDIINKPNLSQYYLVWEWNFESRKCIKEV